MPSKPILAMMAPVRISAGASDDSGPPRFEVVAYTGGAMNLAGWDRPVVIDLEGMNFANSLVANLDHDRSKRVGHVTAKEKSQDSLVLSGVASAATESRREVVESAADGFIWQASVEANPDVVTEVAEGNTVNVNGMDFEGPIYVASKTTLTGFGFVSHGADDNTQVTIAATADSLEDENVNPKLKAWIEEIGFDAENISDDQLATLKANYRGHSPQPQPKPATSSNPFEARKLEAARRREMREIADRQIELRNSDEQEIIDIEKMYDHAVEAGMTVDKFRLALYESLIPLPSRPSHRRRESQVSTKVVQAAICQAGRLPNIEDHFDERTLEAAHNEFKGRIGLKEVLLLAAQENNQPQRSSGNVDSLLRAAFSKPTIQAGFSTLDISNVVAATANKFIFRGWNSVDMTPLSIARIQNVSDFKTATTVSLTDSVIYEKVGAGGEIKHGTLADLTYTNKADTYAQMLAITRQDIINDDLGALTDVPMKLGNGAAKKLNDIFWTEFLGLVGASFFASGNSNINTGVATMTEAGLDDTYVIFKEQTNPDGTPLGAEPRILLVPTALEGAARRLVRSEQFQTGATTMEGSTNIWAGRFTVYSSPYISNSSYTGNTAVGWWMLADPNEIPVITIAALNGRVEPTVDTADADFNTLGVQMRGYCDIGVSDTEYRGGVYADGGAS